MMQTQSKQSIIRNKSKLLAIQPIYHQWKGGENKADSIKISGLVGVVLITPGNLMNFFPLRRDKKEDT